MALSLREHSEALANLVASLRSSVVRVEGGRPRPASGVVLEPGTVVAAHHALPSDEVTVALEGGGRVAAKVRARSPRYDLAVLDVEGATAAPAWSEGEGLRVGNLVLALGRPGVTLRATAGIVGALGTEPFRVRGAELDRYLEADAAHQPGFSGGPLVDADGRVLGMNTSGLLRGQSLTVPTRTIIKVVKALAARGAARRGYLGVNVQPVRLPVEVQEKTKEELGLLVLGVDAAGPASAAGLLYADTVLHLGPAEVKTLEDLETYLATAKEGERLEARVWRAGQELALEVVLGARP